MLERDDFENSNSRLSVRSRFSNSPDPLHFELTDDGYRIVGPGNSAIRKYAQIYELLPKEPPGVTRGELMEKTRLGRWQLNTALRELQACNNIGSYGSGIEGDPVCFHRITM